MARAMLSQCTEARCTVIQGLITSKDVFLRGALIVREFGIATWLRCCVVLLSGRRTTFLELIFQVTARATPLPALRTARVGPAPAKASERIGRSRGQGESK
jgi:hypothetical protein